MSAKRKNETPPITSFFAKQPKKCDTDAIANQSSVQEIPNVSNLNSEESEFVFTEANVSTQLDSDEQNKQLSDTSQTSQSTTTDKYDIGKYVEIKRHLKDDEKAELLRKTWKPDGSHRFEPQCIAGKKRTFQLKWLERFPWLCYSDVLMGALCKFCVLFGPNYNRDTGVGKGSHQATGSLVKTAFVNWKRAIEVFENHSRLSFHKTAAIDAANFLAVYDGKQDEVALQLNQQAKKNALENRKKLLVVVETILLCGRQEIALRGHVDHGRLSLNEPEHNDGNFRTLLCYRARNGDETLKDHIEKSGGNAMYTSPMIQNEIIGLIATTIQRAILARVSKAKFFTVLADETTDIQRIEQFSLCVRYVDYDSMVLREDFLEFVPVYDLSGAGLAKTIKERLTALGFDLNAMRGQGYDGASAMRGEFRGVQAVIQNEYPKAVYTHCSAHCLNLCLNDASRVVSVRHCFLAIAEVCTFFRASARRSAILKEKLAKSSITSSGLMRYCETRWVERHDAVALFVSALPFVIESLEDLVEAKKDDAAKAQCVHNTVCQFGCVVALIVCEKMLSLTHTLSEYLQSKSLDLSRAMAQIELVGKKIAVIRASADQEFATIYKRASDICEPLGVTPSMPRRCGTSRYRSNHPADSVEEYYRRTLFIPYLDELGSSLSERFLSHKKKIVGLQCLVPVNVNKFTFEDLKPAIEFYENDLKHSNEALLRGEWDMWSMRWQDVPEEVPKCALSALELCNQEIFPNVHILLTLLATLPVSTASVERSFSTLKRVKTYLRNRTGEERLTGLALMTIHRNIPVSPESIIDTFAKRPRRIVLL